MDVDTSWYTGAIIFVIFGVGPILCSLYVVGTWIKEILEE